jgi:hypothetical protein
MNTEMPLSKCKENNHILIRIHGRKKYTYSGVDESSAMVCYCCLIRFTMELMHLECHGKRMPKLFFIANRRRGEWFSTTPPYAVKIQHLSI